MRLFRADEMKYTPFFRSEEAERLGAVYTSTPKEADIIVSRTALGLRPHAKLGKKLVIWTHEPRFNKEFTSPTIVPKIPDPVFVMNAYTGRIYADPFYYFNPTNLSYDTIMAQHRASPPRAAMLATFREGPNAVLRDGRNLDLITKRQALGLALHFRGFCDIYGRRWPSSIEIMGESRGEGWPAAKNHILARYAVNIAYENTLIPYYLTEKLWQAVIGGCLPVVHATEGVYDIFPRGSVVDGAGRTVEAIANELVTMTPTERTERYEACLKAYLQVNAPATMQESKRAAIERTRAFLGEVMESR